MTRRKVKTPFGNVEIKQTLPPLDASDKAWERARRKAMKLRKED